jgi:hypothetical protein
VGSGSPPVDGRGCNRSPGGGLGNRRRRGPGSEVRGESYRCGEGLLNVCEVSRPGRLVRAAQARARQGAGGRRPAARAGLRPRRGSNLMLVPVLASYTENLGDCLEGSVPLLPDGRWRAGGVPRVLRRPGGASRAGSPFAGRSLGPGEGSGAPAGHWLGWRKLTGARRATTISLNARACRYPTPSRVRSVFAFRASRGRAGRAQARGSPPSVPSRVSAMSRGTRSWAGPPGGGGPVSSIAQP